MKDKFIYFIYGLLYFGELCRIVEARVGKFRLEFSLRDHYFKNLHGKLTEILAKRVFS